MNIQLPDIGEGIESAEIIRVAVRIGEVVLKEQTLLEVESEKATIEIPSPKAGVIESIKVSLGDKVSKGQVICTLKTGTSADESQLENISNKSKTRTSVDESQLENISNKSKTGASADESQLENISNESKTGASADESQLENISNKSKRGTSVDESQLENISNKSKTRTSVDESQLENISNESKTGTSADESQLSFIKSWEKQTPIPAAPSVRRLARELGIDIYEVKGSGIGGRIHKDDIKKYAKHSLQRSYSSHSKSAFFPLPDFEAFGPCRREKMTSIRQKIANKMQFSWQEIPHVVHFEEAHIENLETSRQRRNKASLHDSKKVKLSMSVILLKILAKALLKFPQFNASINLEEQSIIYKEYINLGVAVDTSQGLIVVVIPDTNKKSLDEISVELGSLVKKARERKVSPKDLLGSTFTLSNLGSLGTRHFTPIINWPEVAILGVGNTRNSYLPLSLSYDHRIIDGADAGRFLHYLVEAIEYPLDLL